MIQGPAIYGTFPSRWVEAAAGFAAARDRSNCHTRGSNMDRGESKNITGHVLGMIGERLAQEHRPDLGVSPKRLHASGACAPKVDGIGGIDVKSSPWGRHRVLVNCRQAASTELRGVVVVLIDISRTLFWMSPVVPIEAIRSWPVFDGKYGDPAHYQTQAGFLAMFPIFNQGAAAEKPEGVGSPR